MIKHGFTMQINTVLLALLATSASMPMVYAAGELTVYSSRNASYLKPLFDHYSRETGVRVAYLVGPANALISRLQLEGENTKADVFFTTGAEHLWQAEQLDLLAQVSSKTLARNIPKHLKSTDNQWFGLSKRVRTIVYNPQVTNAKQLTTYQGLADPKWRAKLCLRSGNDSYSQALVASSIATIGEQKTLAMLKGWVANLALPPMADDMEVLRAVHQGQCAVGIVNSYYLARFKLEQPKSALQLFWANQKGAGVNVNITGAAVVKQSKNKAQAVDLIEFLSTRQVQVKYAKLSMEYPVHPKVYPPRTVARWGKFKENKTNVAVAGQYQAQAIELIKQSGY